MGSKTKATDYYWRGAFGQFSFNGGKPTYAVFNKRASYARSASDNPFYKRTIRAGGNATNALRTEAQTLYYKPGKATAMYSDSIWRPKATGEVISTNMLANWAPDVHTDRPSFSLREYVSNAALTGIIKKIRKYETSEFAGPTFIGELRETVAMLRSPLKALRTKTGLFTDLQMRILKDKQARGKRFKPEPWSRVLSDTYLEWAFGAAPLISDVGAISQMYLDMKNDAFPDRKSLKRLSFRFSDNSSASPVQYDLGWPGTYIYVKVDLIDTYRASEQYVVWIDHDFLFNDSGMERLVRLAKFDLYEIIPTAWELMPWSFLFDYWTNVGDVLGCAFEYNRNVAFGKKTTFETRTKFHANFRGGSTDPKFNVLLELVPHQYTSQYTRVERVPVSKLGFPGLNFSLPSVGQSFNMAALMVSLSKANPFRGFTLK